MEEGNLAQKELRCLSRNTRRLSSPKESAEPGLAGIVLHPRGSESPPPEKSPPAPLRGAQSWVANPHWQAGCIPGLVGAQLCCCPPSPAKVGKDTGVTRPWGLTSCEKCWASSGGSPPLLVTCASGFHRPSLASCSCSITPLGSSPP